MPRVKTYKPCSNCGKLWNAEDFYKWGAQCKSCRYVLGKARKVLQDPKINKAYQKHYYQTRRDKFFEMYGWTCRCCAEGNPKLLTVEHKDNNQVERGQPSKEYVRAIKEYRPDLWEVLCYNCNCGRAHNNGICPHVETESVTYGI